MEFFNYLNSGNVKYMKDIAIKENRIFDKLQILQDALKKYDTPLVLEKTKSFKVEDNNK